MEVRRCNPSVALQVGAREDATFTQLQMLLVDEALARGWIVSIADDGGPQAAFGSPLAIRINCMANSLLRY